MLWFWVPRVRYDALAAEHAKLKLDAMELAREFQTFKKEYDDYRLRFDPVRPQTEGNVTYLRGEAK